MIWDETFDFEKKEINILLIGEIVIDIIHNHKAKKKSIMIGGSPYNVCKNLTKLGISNRFYGAAGNDFYGYKVLEQIKAKKIDANIQISKKPTSFVIINQTVSSPTPVFNRSADSHIYINEKLKEDVLHSKILHFTYWAISKNPSRKTILEIIDIAKTNNTLIGFDPNYHPLLDNHDKTGFKILKDIINKVDIIKPSLDDSSRMFGKKTIDEYLEIYESLGAKLIIMTLGKDGLIARFKGETLRIPSVATKIIDSTGAGDAFWSGLYAGIINKLTIKQSLKLGLIFSALNLKQIGADFDIQKYDELIKTIRW